MVTLRVSKKVMRPDALTTLVVGDDAEFDGKLDTLGPVTTLEMQAAPAPRGGRGRRGGEGEGTGGGRSLQSTRAACYNTSTMELLLKALIMGIVEGATEFLPVSSTGHLILAGSLLGLHGDKAKVFDVFIQSGAMLAIVWEYRARFGRVLSGLGSDPAARRFAANVIVAFLPAAFLGLAVGKLVKEHLFRPVPVALAFIVGALVILWAERRRKAPRVETVEEMTLLDAFKVGCAQCLALVPGTSRSGATIIGGMLFGLSRRAATEFSFFLAVPTLLAAGGYDLLKNRALLDIGDAPMFGVGFVAAFVSAFACVRWFLRYVAAHDFTAFAWYRIAFGIVVLVTAHQGWVHWAAD